MLKETKVTSLLFIFIWFFVSSCNQNWEVPSDLAGEWESGVAEITVRTEYKTMEFEFIADTGIITFMIFEDKTASGTIGKAVFEKVELKKNFGIPSITGVGYIIKCGAVSEIFDRDPLDSKEVEIWLSPMNENQTMQAELRYTEGGAHFPMSGFEMKKVK